MKLPTSQGLNNASRQFSKKSTMMEGTRVNIWEIEAFKKGAEWMQEQLEPKWIDASEREKHLKDGDTCWIEMDYSEWGRKVKRVVVADVHFTNIPQGYGGPNSLTGSGYLTGIYFSLPSICNPDAVKRFCKIEPPKED